MDPVQYVFVIILLDKNTIWKQSGSETTWKFVTASLGISFI